MRRKKDTTIYLRVDKETKRALQIKAKNVGLTLTQFMLIWAMKGLYGRKEFNKW